MRLHLFEFEDQPWFPAAIRDGGTDYLRFLFGMLKYYAPAIPVLRDVLKHAGENQILDLCSGGGGPIEQISAGLRSMDVRCVLSDKYPNLAAFRELKERTDEAIDFHPTPVDVMDVPQELPGVRTMFSALHHFKPADVEAILRQTVDNGRPIAIFDSGDKHPGTILGILLIHPILFFLCTPFFRPFRWSRILFTYLIPLIPLYTVWDGVVSVFRLYAVRSLRKIIARADPDGQYRWECGRLKHKLGARITYLTGIPNA